MQQPAVGPAPCPPGTVKRPKARMRQKHLQQSSCWRFSLADNGRALVS